MSMVAEQPYIERLDWLILNLEEHGLIELEKRGVCHRQADLLTTYAQQPRETRGENPLDRWTLIDQILSPKGEPIDIFHQGSCLICTTDRYDGPFTRCSIDQIRTSLQKKEELLRRGITRPGLQQEIDTLKRLW